jgi:formate hydrogenlyase subunit 4
VTAAALGLGRLVVWLALAPLLPGIVTRIKARMAGREGPPILQLYYDLARLWSKESVLSYVASPGFVAGPAVAWVALVGAALLLPLGPLRAAGTSFTGDALLLVYLLALARFATTWAALDTGSAFEGMGAAREVSFAVLSEASVMTALLALAVQSGTPTLDAMLMQTHRAGAPLLAAGIFVVLLAENSRVPFDDPSTHLELTMVHEAMVLDHSGPPLAAVLHGASVKLLLFAVVLVEMTLPLSSLSAAWAAAAVAVAVVLVAAVVGLVESLLARYAFERVPLLLTTAFLLCLFGLLSGLRITS